MYIMTGVSKTNNKQWYQLVVIEKDKSGNVVTKAKVFISESIYNALKSNGIKVYENTFTEVK